MGFMIWIWIDELDEAMRIRGGEMGCEDEWI